MPRVARGARAGDAALGAIVVVASLGWFLWRISAPFPWEDEGATYIVMSRTWRQFIAVWHGADAPLVPYYLLNRLWLDVLHATLGASLTMGPIRSLSAVAAALAAGCVYALAMRWRGRWVGLLAAAVFVQFPGVGRYAQEARPYALLMFGTTLSWLAWDVWRAQAVTRGRGAGPLRGLGYSVVLAGTSLIHLFGLFQWPAQVLATWLVGGTGGHRERWRTTLRAGLWMLLALVLAGYPVAVAASRGKGGWGPLPVTPTTVFFELVTVVFYTTHVPASALVVLVALGLLAVSELLPRPTRSEEHQRRRAFTLVLLIWFAIPFALAVLAAVVIKPALMQTRYWMPFAPPLAILTTVGLIRLAELVVGIVGRFVRLPAATLATRILSFLLAAALLVPMMWGDNLSSRSLGGHGRNPTGVLKVIEETRSKDPAIPVCILPYTIDASFAPVAPRLVADNPLLALHPNSSIVWPTPRSRDAISASLAHSPEVLVVFGGHAAHTEPAPSVLVSLGYRTIWRKSSWPGYSVLLLRRSS